VESPNVELVRSIYAAWERGDYSSAEWADPEIEWVFPDGPDPGSWRGLAGVKEASRDFMSAWENHRAEPEGYRELDDERVLVLVRYSGRGRRSGVELSDIAAKGAQLFHVHGGKVTRLVRYLDRDHALADLGLAPEGGSQR
jgi:ketosteroid isomerase-like protein